MAKLAVLTDANQPIGTPLAIPDIYIPYLRQTYGGATNAETANNYLAWVRMVTRKHVRAFVKAEAGEAQYPVVQNAEAQAAADVDAAWP